MYSSVLLACMSTHQMHADASKGQSRESDALGLEYNWLWTTMWMLRVIKPGCSWKAASARNCRLISPDPKVLFNIIVGVSLIYLGAHCHDTCLEVRDNSVWSVLSFHLSVGFGNQILVIRLVQQAPLPKKPSLQPRLPYLTEALTEPGPVSLWWLKWWSATSWGLSAFSCPTPVTDAHCHPSPYVGSGIWTQAFISVQWVLHPLGHLHNLSIFIIKIKPCEQTQERPI